MGSLAAVALAAIAVASRSVLLFSAVAALTGPVAYAVARTLRRRPAHGEG